MAGTVDTGDRTDTVDSNSNGMFRYGICEIGRI